MRIDDDALYKMPAFTGRNIVIFSDGTGQAGGLLPDEVRSNVYKLFRATRCGPDTDIDPDKQLSFYDPGLGSPSAEAHFKTRIIRKIFNALSSATGLGITKNVIDCYAALIYLWRPGDRIFLFGFSRGAYTVRCLGGVLGLCGIPQKMPGDRPLLRDAETIKRIAREAVKRVYRHGSGADEEKTDTAQQRKKKLGVQRRALGAQFRDKYHSNGPNGPNVVPHFIGVWDTVAAVGITPPAWKILGLVLGLFFLVVSAGAAWLIVEAFNISFWLWFAGIFLSLRALVYLAYIVLRVKFTTGLPGHKWHELLHLIPFKMSFFDRTLNKNVRYARHAIAIDEKRADFDRVPWVNEEDPPNREKEEGAWFKQFWFAGNHSDIGGSYAENESRLSDISLGWMSHQAKKAGLLVDNRYLILFGSPSGPQHDECRVGINFLGFNFKWKERTRKMVDNATIHPSVLERFKLKNVLIYDEERAYRPDLLRQHKDFKDSYEEETRALAEAKEFNGPKVGSTT